uniref:Uncharacterized protein n=1 Tax=Steinernema glaseri TaxID=37863 RepID=A0A1I7YE89_9BILA
MQIFLRLDNSIFESFEAITKEMPFCVNFNKNPHRNRPKCGQNENTNHMALCLIRVLCCSLLLNYLCVIIDGSQHAPIEDKNKFSAIVNVLSIAVTFWKALLEL